MIITKEDVGRRVRLRNGDVSTIQDFKEGPQTVLFVDDCVYTKDGSFLNYSETVKFDIEAFVEDSSTTEQIKDKFTPLEDDFSYPIATETKNKDIDFTIPENTVSMELEINGYRINVTKIQE